MKKLGLALSGGGFRATLYHLGLTRFLRDAGILPQVTHITSVSGGSIFAAHLVLNWDRYNGAASEFDAAASELLEFVRLDVRNRITRRFPLWLFLRGPRRFLGLSNRKLTRTGLLEFHYQKHLYGDVSLFELPETPQLHLLTTNVSEGCLCSFNRNGLLMVRRQNDSSVRVDPVHVGLATVAMAVTASSAFPGFFPPLELTADDVGAKAGDFGRQAYTDGGVFDNLGVRMFRCLEPTLLADHGALDGVLVSDVGKRIEVQSGGAGGLIRTALRASDILMDRVWQLESETFEDSSGFIFARMTDVVDPAEDPTALHPEIQRQAANIRTDLDRFSPLEISSLIRHGYCIGRKSCRAHPKIFGANLPSNAPWDPIAKTRAGIAAGSILERDREPAEITVEARTLQASALRRIWSTLLDYRDWTSYVYVPLIVPILVCLPWFIIDSYKHSHRVNVLMQSFAQGSRDLDQLIHLLEYRQRPWVGVPAEEVPEFEKYEFNGYEILQDSYIVNLRDWQLTPQGKGAPGSMIYAYRRLKVLKLDDRSANHPFRLELRRSTANGEVRFPRQQLTPTLRTCFAVDSAKGAKKRRKELYFDFEKIAPGEAVDLLWDIELPAENLEPRTSSSTMVYEVEADTAEMTAWILMPDGLEYKSFQLTRHKTGMPQTTERVRVVTEYLAEDYTILAFKLLSVKAGYTYEIEWLYQ